MSSRIVITDPHGCYNSLLALIAKLPKGIPITLAGDLIDRGPMSREIVQYVIDNKIDCVKGNHEVMAYQKDIIVHTRNGGDVFYKQYKGEPEVLKEHLDFMSKLPLYLEYPKCLRVDGRHLLVTHSYACKVWNWPKERREQMMHQFESTILWGRDFRGAPKELIYNVFGHTPHHEARIREYFACIDTGCVYGNKLTALQFPEMIIYEQECIDKLD